MYVIRFIEPNKTCGYRELHLIYCLEFICQFSHIVHRLDDPVMWGFKSFPTMDVKLARWVLAAEDICFKNTTLSYFFRLGMISLLWLFVKF